MLRARQAQLTFVVVGGGATGVESAGALSELVQKVFVKDYHRLQGNDVRIILLEAAQRLLPGMPDESSDYAIKTLQGKGVEVFLGAKVSDFDGYQVTLDKQTAIPCRTLIWASRAYRASPLTHQINSERAGLGTFSCYPPPYSFLTITISLPSVMPPYFTLSDHPLPMIAPVAVQQSRSDRL